MHRRTGVTAATSGRLRRGTRVALVSVILMLTAACATPPPVAATPPGEPDSDRARHSRQVRLG